MSVYFAIAGPYMKIGYSWNPINRMNTVTTNGRTPDDLPADTEVDLIGWIPGGRELEREFHKRFANTRVAGEWFWADREEAARIVWDDPRGVDIEKMSMQAVLVMKKYPHATRDEVAAAGVQVEATPLDEAMLRFNQRIADALGGAA